MLSERNQKTHVEQDDWILGQAESPVTLLEYGDFECPYCAEARPLLQDLVAGQPDTVHLVFRHFPVATTHPHALIAAEAAEAAGAQGKFWEMHDMLLTHQNRLIFDDLRIYAEKIGLDMARFDHEMATHQYEEEIQRDFRAGIQQGVNGTPSIFINGLRYDGPREPDWMLAAIKAQAPG